ncbi:MAG: hypothetical protein ABJO05_20445, partial [Roseibium sp.]
MTFQTLSDAQLESFDENGFLAIDRLVPEEDLVEIEQEYAQLLDDTAAHLYAAGKISDLHKNLDFGDRYSAIIAECSDLHRHFNVSLPLVNEVLEPKNFHMHTGPAVFNL